jgi:hypothetical protein
MSIFLEGAVGAPFDGGAGFLNVSVAVGRLTAVGITGSAGRGGAGFSCAPDVKLFNPVQRTGV